MPRVIQDVRAASLMGALAEAIDAVFGGRSPVEVVALRLGSVLRASFVGHVSLRSPQPGVLLWWTSRGAANEANLETSTLPWWDGLIGQLLEGVTALTCPANYVVEVHSQQRAPGPTGRQLAHLAVLPLPRGGEDVRLMVFQREIEFTQDELDVLGLIQLPLWSLDRHFENLPSRDGRDRVHLKRCHDAAQSLSLTPREMEVLGLLAEGLMATTIAARLAVSPRTVHKHLGNVYNKLDAHDRLGAVDKARTVGLIPPVRSHQAESDAGVSPSPLAGF